MGIRKRSGSQHEYEAPHGEVDVPGPRCLQCNRRGSNPAAVQDIRDDYATDVVSEHRATVGETLEP